MLRVLREWLTETVKEYPTRRVRRNAVNTLKKSTSYSETMRAQMIMSGMFDTDIPLKRRPESCTKEGEFYDATGILPLASRHYKLYRPELRACIEKFCTAKTQDEKRIQVEKAGKIADQTWATNVTLLDLEWQRVRPPGEVDTDDSHDPFEFPFKLEGAHLNLAPTNPTGLFDHISL
jgi:hypothetical protein